MNRSSPSETTRNTLHEYSPPSFAQRVAQHAPKFRLQLCMRPTPIHPLDLGDALGDPIPPSVTLCVKRDDLTSCLASGNKLRKLEFLLADAIHSGHDSVITAGGLQSNHARSVTVISRQLGLTPHVFLRRSHHTSHQPDEPPEPFGNVLLHRIFGANIHVIDKMPYVTGILPRMQTLKERLQQEGQKAYLICIGGSDPVGLWGYIEAYAELLRQNVHKDFTHVAVAVGSGGTTAGLCIANYLFGSPLRIVAFSVSDTPQYFYDHVDEMLQSLNLSNETSAKDILTVIDSKGVAYGVVSDEDQRCIPAIAQRTGLLFDATYTYKALKGLHRQLLHPDLHPNLFDAHSRVLFIHTGGAFGMFDRRVEPFLS